MANRLRRAEGATNEDGLQPGGFRCEHGGFIERVGFDEVTLQPVFYDISAIDAAAPHAALTAYLEWRAGCIGDVLDRAVHSVMLGMLACGYCF